MKQVLLVMPMLLAGCIAAGTPAARDDLSGSDMKQHEQHGERQLVAAFGDQGQLQQSYPQAELAARYGEVTLWHLKMTEERWKHLEGLGRYSPVFGQEQGQLKALPGGIILRFKSGLSATQEEDWFLAQGLSARPLGSLAGAYVIMTAPGRPALDLARRLMNLPEVATAEPDWWQPRSLRRQSR